MSLRVRLLVLLVALTGCGAAVAEEAPPPMESSPLETGMVPHAERPAVVVVAVDRRIDALAGRVMDCVAGRASLAVELGVRRSGTIYEVRGDDVGSARACVRNALLGARVSAPLTSDLLLAHTFVRPPPASATPPPATTPEPPREDPTRTALAAPTVAPAGGGELVRLVRAPSP